MKLHLLAPICLALLLIGERPSPCLLAQDRAQQTADAASQKNPGVGEKIPSEDDRILDFHSLGLINNHTNVFRSASPVRDLIDSAGHAAPEADSEAKLRMQHLHDLGIRTIISFENPDAKKSDDISKDEGKIERVRTCVALRKRRRPRQVFNSFPIRSRTQVSIPSKINPTTPSANRSIPSPIKSLPQPTRGASFSTVPPATIAQALSRPTCA